MLMKRDRMIVREALRRRRKPYILPGNSSALVQSAKEYPSPKASLRPLSLYTMFVLFIAGLEWQTVGLRLAGIREASDTIDIRDTVLKSRRLPLSERHGVLRRYLLAAPSARS